MTDTQPSTAQPGTAIDARWVSAPCAALTVSSGGTVLEANDAAADMLPRLRPGQPLAQILPRLATAHEPVSVRAGAREPISDVVDGRAVRARPVRHDDGSVTWWLIDATDVDSLRAELHREQARASFLSEASAALLGSLNLLRCIQVTAELAVSDSGPADGALVLTSEGRGQFRVATAVRGGDTARVALLRIDPDEVPGMAEALQGFPPVPFRRIDPADTPGWLVPAGLGAPGSIVVTSLPGHGVPAGAMVLLRRAGSGPFGEDSAAMLREFATRSGLAISAARMFAQQASITETLMRDLLPPTLQEVAGVEFAGGYRPSPGNGRVGGDFYDVHPGAEDGEETLVVLGDVCGKGLEAAVLTGKIRSALQVLLPLAGDHQRMLSLLNDALLTDADARFVTLVLASVARRGSDVAVRLTCAGHPAPLIIRADGRVEEAATQGTLVGVLPSVEAGTAETTLAPGDTCLLYTDGITEAHGGPLGRDLFGEDRLHRVAAECAGMPPEAVVERVQMVAADWAGHNSHDDIAVLAITAPRGHRAAVVDQGGCSP